MKEIETLLKAVADGLKTMAQGIASLSDKVNEIAKQQGAQQPSSVKEAGNKPAKKTASRTTKVNKSAKTVSKKSPKKESVKAASSKKNKAPQKKAVEQEAREPKTAPSSAAEEVLQLIQNSPEGLTTESLLNSTGFNQKKLSNILYKLKQQGKIKNIRRGTYAAG